MSMMEEMSFFFGLQVIRKPGSILICQSKYIKNLLKKYGMEEAATAKTLMPTVVKLN